MKYHPHCPKCENADYVKAHGEYWCPECNWHGYQMAFGVSTYLLLFLTVIFPIVFVLLLSSGILNDVIRFIFH